ncbi:MAG: NGG1p interacting factor NIF3 [Candidatus Moranbacteria bacterium]|nr:NGG1p interacting factor NIF3 [Candidatus Moranbacteria bacterium]
MTIEQIFKLAVEMGIGADMRGKEFVKKQLKKTKEKFEKLSKEKKADFDQEKLWNPYSDSRILFGDPKKKVKRVMVGIDVDPSELMIARYFSDKNKEIDLVIGHHPIGEALNDLADVMHLQADVLARHGVPINIAESVMLPRITEISRLIFQSENYGRTVQAAELLGLPLMCVHTPADNLVANFIDREIKKQNPETLEELLEIIDGIPEYKEAKKFKAGPQIVTGRKEARVGKIAYEYAGGTNGAKEIYKHASQAGIGTIVGMHMREEWRKEAEKHHINVVICGDTQSDSIGMNLFLDELEKKGIEIIPFSGLTRVKRFGKK